MRLRGHHLERIWPALPLQSFISIGMLGPGASPLSRSLRLSHTSIGLSDSTKGLRIFEDHVAVVVEHAHRGLKVSELDRIHLSDLLIRGLLLEHEFVELLCCRVLLKAEDFG